MGWSDSQNSHQLILCRTRYVVEWIKSSLAEEDRRQEGSSGSERSEDEILVTAREGRLVVSTKAPRDYMHGCGRDDTSHPLYGVSYFMYTGLVKTEEDKRAKRASADPYLVPGTAPTTASVQGRPSATRYPFSDGYKPTSSQYLRALPSLLNITCEPPVEDSNPEGFERLS